MKFRLCEGFFDINDYDIGDRVRILLRDKKEYIGKITEITEDYIKLETYDKKEQIVETKDINKIKTIDINETFDLIEYFDNIERQLAEGDDIEESLTPKQRKATGNVKYPKNSYNLKQLDGMSKTKGATVKTGYFDPQKEQDAFNRETDIQNSKNTSKPVEATGSTGASSGASSGDAGGAGGDAGGAM